MDTMDTQQIEHPYPPNPLHAPSYSHPPPYSHAPPQSSLPTHPSYPHPHPLQPPPPPPHLSQQTPTPQAHPPQSAPSPLYPAPRPFASYPDPPRPFPSPPDDLSAAQVLASFHRFPIHPPDTHARGPLTLPLPSPSRPIAPPSRLPPPPLRNDHLQSDIMAASTDLPSTLRPIAHPSPRTPSTDHPTGLANCRGAIGLGGSLIPRSNHPSIPKQTVPHSSATSQTASHQSNTNPVLSDPPASRQPPVKRHSKSDPANAVEPGSGHDKNISQEDTATTRSKDDSSAKEGFKTTFQFVVNEDTKEARHTVRKHVMREYRRRERWEQDQAQPPNEQPTSASSTDTPKRSRKRQRLSKPRAVRSEQPGTQNDHLRSKKEHSVSLGIGDSDTGQSTHNRYDLSVKVESSSDPTSPGLGSALYSDNGSICKPPWDYLDDELDGVADQASTQDAPPHTSDPWADVAPSSVDPFSKLSSALGPAAQSLLHHFAWVMPSLMDEIVTGTVFRRLGWLYSRVAVHDPTPVHTILGFTVGHLATLRGDREPPLAIEHKAQALRLIKARTDCPSEALSDDTIGAILNVAGFELIDCNPHAFALHMDGMRRLVMGRGGMSSLASNPDLAMTLIRLDAIRAYVCISTPRYPLYTPLRQLAPLAIPVPHAPGPPNASIGDNVSTPLEYRFCEDALHLVHDLEDVLLLARTAADQTQGPIGRTFKDLLSSYLAQTLSPAQSKLVQGQTSSPHQPQQTVSQTANPAFVPSPPSGSISRGRYPIAARCLRLVVLVFMDVAICEFFDRPSPPGVFAQQLKSRFLGPFSRAASASTAWGRSLEMLVAVLLQADRVALERPWRAFYIADILTLTMKLSDLEWQSIQAELDVYIDERVQAQKKETQARATPHSSVQGEVVEGLVQSAPRSWSVWDLDAERKSFSQQWDSIA